MPKQPSKSQRLIEKAGHELKANPPAVLRRKRGKAREKQRVAIMLAKARKAGARVPKAPA